jgi:putative membrane protein
MFEPRRQHPVAAVTGALRSLREMIIPLVIILFVGTGSDSQIINLSVAGVIIVMLFVLGVVRWLRFTYRVEDDELRIEHGLFVRKKKYIPKERIQVIDVRSGVIQRMFGLVSLTVQTAGDNRSGAEINALTKEDAILLRQLLNGETVRHAASPDVTSSDTETEATSLADANAGATSQTEADTEITTPGPGSGTADKLSDDALLGRTVLRGGTGAEAEPIDRWVLNPRHLVIAATTAGSFGIALSIIGTLFSQVQQAIDEEEMAEYMERFILSAGQFWVTVVVGLVVAAWLLSFIGTLIRFYDFRLIRQKQGLVVQSGLFEQKQVTIPYHRIQAIRVVEGILRQPFGYATVYLESAGYGDEAGNRSTIVAPLLRRRDVPDFIRRMLPDFDVEAEAVTPPPRSRFRFIFRGVRPIALFLVLPGLIFLDLAWYPLLLLPFGAWLGIRRYRDAAAGVYDHTVLIRSRALALTTAIIRKHRLQASELFTNPFQRRLSLASFTVTVASGDGGHPFTAQDLDDGIAGEFLHWAAPGEHQPGVTEFNTRLPGFVPFEDGNMYFPDRFEHGNDEAADSAESPGQTRQKSNP